MQSGQWDFNISLPIIVYGPVAPMVERGPEEPSVGGSNPPRSAVDVAELAYAPDCGSGC